MFFPSHHHHLLSISLSFPLMRSLLNLPDDVLLTIALSLSIQDVLSLKQVRVTPLFWRPSLTLRRVATQTCRVLHAFGTTDYLWHRLIEDFDLPLDIPQNVASNGLSAEELQEVAIKAMRLEVNWRKPISSIKRSAKVQGMTQEQCVHMQFLPGGKWLLTIQRYHRLLMTRFTTRMSIWSVEDLHHPHRILSVELKGSYRASAFCLCKGCNSATLAVGLHETHGEWANMFHLCVFSNLSCCCAVWLKFGQFHLKRSGMHLYPIRQCHSQLPQPNDCTFLIILYRERKSFRTFP